MNADEIHIFGGSGSPRLTAAICERLGLAPARGEVIRFSEGNLFVRVKENVRGRRVYVVQSTVFPANDLFMELLFWIDALRRATRRTSRASRFARASVPMPSKRRERIAS